MIIETVLPDSPKGLNISVILHVAKRPERIKDVKFTPLVDIEGNRQDNFDLVLSSFQDGDVKEVIARLRLLEDVSLSAFVAEYINLEGRQHKIIPDDLLVFEVQTNGEGMRFPGGLLSVTTKRVFGE